MKSLFIIAIMLLSSVSYAASQPAVKVSRANCPAPLPQWMGLPGVGYQNESISYDRLLGNHKLRVTSNQINGAGQARNFFYPGGFSFATTWRAYAGIADPTANVPGWTVTGNHEEMLDSGQYLQSNTFAKNCNITEW